MNRALVMSERRVGKALAWSVIGVGMAFDAYLAGQQALDDQAIAYSFEHTGQQQDQAFVRLMGNMGIAITLGFGALGSAREAQVAASRHEPPSGGDGSFNPLDPSNPYGLTHPLSSSNPLSPTYPGGVNNPSSITNSLSPLNQYRQPKR